MNNNELFVFVDVRYIQDSFNLLYEHVLIWYVVFIYYIVYVVIVVEINLVLKAYNLLINLTRASLRSHVFYQRDERA